MKEKPMIGFARRWARAGLRRTSRLLQTVAPPAQAWGNFMNPAFAYASTNALLARFMVEEPTLYPMYTWGLMHGALLAKALKIDRVSAIEFGVAGGNGLVALERAAVKLEDALGVAVDVHGFDTGMGLPKPTDYRDAPNVYTESTYRMDVPKLRARLERAQLHLGLAADTIPTFLASVPAPIAFISVDLDFYSSTVDALQVLNAGDALILPRVHCYFDDIMGLTCSEFTGERLAIAEFNQKHDRRKISPIFGLKYFLAPPYAQQQWAEMMYLAHVFDHPLYGHSDGLVVSSERPLASLATGNGRSRDAVG